MNSFFNLASLLAVTFGNPLMLWGLSLAAIPLLLHFFNRRRYQTHRWAAMKFLHAAARKTARRNQFENYLLLLLRTLLIALVVLALAYPEFETSPISVPQQRTKHRILVVDDTLSMQHSTEGVTRRQRAKQAISQLVNKSGSGDLFQLMRISSLEPYVLIAAPTLEKERILEKMESLTGTYEPGNLEAVLQALITLLSHSRKSMNTEVVIITDLQATLWQPADEDAQHILQSHLDNVTQQANLSFWDVSNEDYDNCAITNLMLTPSPCLRNEEVQIEAEIQNFGTAPAELDATLEIDGEIVRSKPLALAASERTVVVFPHRFSSVGDAIIRLRISDDQLPADNVRWARQQVRSAYRVLLVNGKPSAEEMGNATDYVDLALRASLEQSSQNPQFQIETITEEDLYSTRLDDFDVVFLCNIGLVTEQETKRLEQFTRQGGSVVITLGDQVQPESYNRQFYKQGAGLLPAKLTQIKNQDSETVDPYEFLTGNIKHPLLSVFDKYPNAGLQSTPTFTYFDTNTDANSKSRIVLRYSTNDAAMLEKNFGQGHVFLITTALDRDWSAFVVWPSFLPVMRELVPYLCRYHNETNAVLVGQPILVKIAKQTAGESGLLRMPDGHEQPVHTVSTGSDHILFEHTGQPGIYELLSSDYAARLNRLAVNLDPRESNLKPSPFSLLKKTLLADGAVTYRQELSTLNHFENQQPDKSWSAASGILILVVCLVLVEQLIAWRFVAGVQAFVLLLMCLSAYVTFLSFSN